ncbi:enoyl-CoA hydratase/isomerase family protein [Sphingopyxis soli]|jgi:enoyl-CoA hydratase/carnithine racemase|uniref:Enoyl-CoA hydratase/isomerase family protein n=1 Tax=Sphingopyxis soli TaxID=592051 RepID=A0ABP3XDS4_9SPHN|nr:MULTISPECIES: enoyl-CoA hydratase/isomerase family protein [Sphingopyxis]MBD3733656.1 enoyl-CoA hydratase/isomerase family protein [Sphingopyxis sp.]MBJ7498208.1 enoyl-CoA hydratase/isomerase family protein [Sphingopyxis sp.]HMO73907.1 enoyl-CoA hydratase/isomerase family protein [Sphingopyxis sp.]HMP43490.1 enoyl-CoA hydratase/isomerase family protein [Sphingopyxis sp.]
MTDKTRAQPVRQNEGLQIHRSGTLDILTLNRPDRLNAIDPRMADALTSYFRQKRDDDDCRVIVLRGAGRAFCAGVDLKATKDAPPDLQFGNAGVRTELAIQRANREFIVEMRRCPQPVIALLHGAVCGAGFALALAADIRIATRDARMNCAFVNVGLGGCDIGVSYLLPRLAGASIASELILTGDFIDAERAHSLGLVSRLVDDASALEDEGRTMADRLLKVAPTALRLSKEALRHAIDAPSIESAIAMEDRNQVLCARTEDFHEAMAAFFERRPAEWRDA